MNEMEKELISQAIRIATTYRRTIGIQTNSFDLRVTPIKERLYWSLESDFGDAELITSLSSFECDLVRHWVRGVVREWWGDGA